MEDYFVDVALPLALPKLLTYKWSGHGTPMPGQRVVVPLRNKKLYTGFVWQVQATRPGQSQNWKEVAEVLDETPFIDERHIRFLNWLGQYYACTLGEVVAAAIPAPFRISSESFLQVHPEYKWNEEELEAEELVVVRWLKKDIKVPVAEILKRMGKPTRWLKLFRQWQQEQKILLFDELPEFYKPRSEAYLSIGQDFRSEEALDAAFSLLENKPEEENLLLRLLAATRFSQQGNWSILKSAIHLSESEKKALSWLQRKGMVVVEKHKQRAPWEYTETEIKAAPGLSDAQLEAATQIETHWSQFKTALLMGVTGSGKTEIYIHFFSKILSEGRQGLLLLPEIAITVQIVNRLRQIFGDQLGVYHSKASLPDRLEVWEGVAGGSLKMVIGVRSAVFLPFQSLGLIVVDEEHDASYKQAEPAPRYHGRDAAIYLAHLHKANVLLGSATPSVESYYKAKSGKWGLVNLNERYGEAQLPEIQIIDMHKMERLLETRLHFSNLLLDRLEQTAAQGKQSILFQNRRGYAPYLQCKDCGWIPYCPNCDVALTYHQSKNSINCHYCSHQTSVVRHCSDCGSVQIQAQGFGTEKLEESLKQLLPHLRIARMDQDTISSRKSYEQLLWKMANNELDVLVGTQMVTKGLDFEKVVTVGVFDLDRVLHYPDFRSNERTFQLLTQIAGRAGRRAEKGLVLVQSYKPYHPIYRMVAQEETLLFYETEVLHRQTFQFPPFASFIKVTARHKEKEIARDAAHFLSQRLTRHLGKDFVLGPEAPPIEKLRNQFIFNLFLRIMPEVSVSKVKALLLAEVSDVQTQKSYASTQWIIDVDP